MEGGLDRNREYAEVEGIIDENVENLIEIGDLLEPESIISVHLSTLANRLVEQMDSVPENRSYRQKIEEITYDNLDLIQSRRRLLFDTYELVRYSINDHQQAAVLIEFLYVVNLRRRVNSELERLATGLNRIAENIDLLIGESNSADVDSKDTE